MGGLTAEAAPAHERGAVPGLHPVLFVVSGPVPVWRSPRVVGDAAGVVQAGVAPVWGVAIGGAHPDAIGILITGLHRVGEHQSVEPLLLTELVVILGPGPTGSGPHGNLHIGWVIRIHLHRTVPTRGDVDLLAGLEPVAVQRRVAESSPLHLRVAGFLADLSGTPVVQFNGGQDIAIEVTD